MANTPLQEAYDAFFIKAGKGNYLYKEDQVFQFFKSAVSKSVKTVKNSLSYKVYQDNVLITVFNICEFDGDIEITINSNNYIISLLATDTKIDIVNKIKSAVESDWDIDVSYITNPRIKITKNGIETIEVEIKDVGNTNVYLVSNRSFEGEFEKEINQDAIELIALFMLMEQKRQRMSELDGIRQDLGTKDFNKLPKYSDEYKNLNQSIENLKDEIFEFRQEFYSYEN